VEDKGDSVIYSLDRQGYRWLRSDSARYSFSAHAKEVAEKLGMILRSTGKVKRGLAPWLRIINISIAEGARVEIKGVQALDMCGTIVDREVTRQVALLEIKKELTT